MARINIEDSIYRDDRFIKLCNEVGGKFAALGVLITAWDLAHHWYLKSPTTFIPNEEWEKNKFPEAIFSVGLAERKDGGVYVKGANDHCEYLKKRRKSAQEAARITNEKRWGHSPKSLDNFVAKRRQKSLSSSSSSSTTNTKNIYIPPECLKQAIEEWRTTLESYGIKKDPSFDEAAIQRLIVRYGPEPTLLAIRGARLEPKTESYDPAKFCSISRLSRPEIFDRFVNLGSQAAEAAVEYDREEVINAPN